MSRRRNRSNVSAFRPRMRPAIRVSRRALAASVSLLTLLTAGGSAFAQQAGTLPGTQVLQGGRWTGARLPTVAQGNEGLVMTITQEQKRALLDWSRFDVAKGEEVRFEQGGADWIALNRIFDSKPSEIAGKITAKGQVWLQNTNGIIFKNGSQINAHTILATALPITEDQLNKGLLSGQGVIRGTSRNMLFSDLYPLPNQAMVPRPVDGLNPGSLLNPTARPIGGETPTIIDLMARAAIRQAVLRDRNYEGVSGTYDQGYALGLLNYYDPSTGKTVYYVDLNFSANGLNTVMESIVAGIDLTQLGDYNYADYTNISNFFSNGSQAGTSAAIPRGLRDAVAAQIKTQFVDNYASLFAASKQNYTNYIANSRIVVEQGAVLKAMTTDTTTPGKIMLFGPNVTNAGRLEAHDGQVLIAAGEQIKLSAGQGYTNSVRGGLTGNVMSVAVADEGGSLPGVPYSSANRAIWMANLLARTEEIGMHATNSGQILTDRGTVTMLGANVEQLGSILVTNGVRQRTGAIVLQASHGFNMSEYSGGGNYLAGSLTLGEGSITRITPDLSALTGLAADTFAPGTILLAGKDILLDRNAEVTSRSGNVTIHANPYGNGARGGTSPAALDDIYMESRGDKGSFTMRAGARIDVSGLRDVERSVADNIFAVEVRSNEVAAAPAQRDGILIGETVYVDRRQGSSLVDWTGALASEQRTASQMSTKGGNVQIRASEFAIIENGATIDVSGGSTKYLGGETKTTILKDGNGRFHSIADANANINYTGLGTTTRVEEGYIEGADAGAVEILSGASKLFGKLKGDVVVGERQQRASIGLIKTPLMPKGAVNAALVTAPALPKAGSVTLQRGGPEYGAWASRHLYIMKDENAFTGDVWTQDDSDKSWSSEAMLLDPSKIGLTPVAGEEGHQPQWINFVEDDFFAGMGSVSFSVGGSSQNQTINSGASISLLDGGSFQMGGEGGYGIVGDNASIVVPSGTITLNSPKIIVGKDVLLSVGAKWVNDVDAPAGTPLGYVNGGTISLFGAELTGTVTLDAMGGGWYKRLTPPTITTPGTFQLVKGKGGSVNLGGSSLSLGELLSFTNLRLGGLAGGGTLGLSAAGGIVIGAAGGSAGEGKEYVSNELLNGIGAGTLALGATSIEFSDSANLLFQQREMLFNGSPLTVATGTDLRSVTSSVLPLAHERGGASFQVLADTITVAKNARIEVDPTGSIDFQGLGIAIDGKLVAHGGSIALGGDGTVRLGSTALLDATGVAQSVKVPGGADGRSFWYAGRILDGGTITINAEALTIDAGATLDVSGTKGMLSVYRQGRFAVVKVNDVIGSDAGSIRIQADSGTVLGTMRGNAGTVYNYAGSLSISGGLDGNLLLPGYTDYQTGTTGLQSLLDNLQYAFYPEPTPENPISLRALFKSNYSYLENQLGFSPDEMEDVKVTGIADFMAFVTAALQPVVMQSPNDVAGALILDPLMTRLPDAPPSTGGQFAVPDGYSPESAQAFDRAITFIVRALAYGPDTSTLMRGTKLTLGARPLADMASFDTVTIGGSIRADSAVQVSSGRVLNLSGIIQGSNDMRFTARNIVLNGALPAGQMMDPATTGTLTISGETVDFNSKFHVGGFKNVTIEAKGDIRGGYVLPESEPANVIAPGLYATGDVLLRAAQIYPTTDGILEFESPSKIRIERTGASTVPLSAGGTLSFAAPLIEQAGTLRAPFGQIELTATRVALLDENGDPLYGEDGEALFAPGQIILLPGSLTSTAAEGRTILYGTTFDGQSWYAPGASSTDSELTTPPEKRVSLTADAIDVRPGAKIDVSGGGDVLGIEFVAGPLGQTNVLEGEGVFAIVPSYGSGVSVPIDPLYNPLDPSAEGDVSYSRTGLGIGDVVWLNGFDGNAAGWYTLLPAAYALTPGGYSVTLSEGMTPMAGASRQLGDKSFAVGGFRGVLGTTIQDQVQSIYRLESGANIRTRSEFFETSGNSFFSSALFLQGLLRSGEPYNADPRLPIDGGFLTLAANSALKLDGTILAAGSTDFKGARGGVVDITSDNIVIAAAGTDVSDLAGYLVLDPNKLSNIAESLLIGGIRRQGAGGLEIVTGQTTRDAVDEVRDPAKSVGAENVVIRTDAANPLTGTELLFAANNTVRVESGSVIKALGDGADAVDLIIAPSMPAFVHPYDASQNAPAEDRGGAFLRVSNLGDILVSRSNVVGDAGDMIVQGGTTIEAADSIILDATRNTSVADGAGIRAGAITAASGLVSFGNAPAGTDGLIVSGSTLAGLGQASKLTLKSYTTFDFYGDVSLNLTGAAVFDGAAFVDRGDAAGNVAIKAGTIELRNTDAAAFDATGRGGSLALTAGNVVLGEGDIDLAYGMTTINAAQRLIFSGSGDDHFDGALTVHAAEITGASGASHEVTAAGAVQMLGNGSTAALPAFTTAGALLDFRGTSIDIAGVIRAGSGTVRATATTGDVHMASGALIDVSGSDVSFFEVQGFLPGGGVQLNAVAGDVLVDAGSTVNISGGKAGGDAGTLVLSAGRGIAVLGGALEAKVAGGYRGGSFGLTTATLVDFGGLNALLNASGFSRSRDFAILDGDVTLNGVTRVDALRLVTGNGSITVTSDAQIGSDSAKGGSILLASGGDLKIADGARFDVGARGVDQRGGSVDLQVAVGGAIDVGAAVINVAANGTGQAGQVRLRAARTGTDVAVDRFGASVTGGGVQLEAFRVYDLEDADGNAGNGHLAEIDTALQNAVIGDASAFMSANAASIRTRLGQGANTSFAIVPGIELRSAGDMDLVNNWNLAAARFEGRPGVLTLRAGGDLTINANLSDGFASATPTSSLLLNGIPVNDLTNDESWSYNLVAGADFLQTNVLATRADGIGDLVIGGIVRTGTGDIQAAAGGDLEYEKATFIGYASSFGSGTKITMPAGTVLVDGTVLKPSTYMSLGNGSITVFPRLPANTVLREGTKLPAGTIMPDGTTLAADTVLAADVKLTAETTFPGEVVISGKTLFGGEMIWSLPDSYMPNPGDAPNTIRTAFNIPGLGDLTLEQTLNGYGGSELRLSDNRLLNSGPIEMIHGAIYTVGVQAAPIADYTPPSKVYAGEFEPFNIAPVYAEKGGDVSIAVGGDIIGAGASIENAEWLAEAGGSPKTTSYGYNFSGKDPTTPFTLGQTSLSLLVDRFRQGVGALGGGDVSIVSGGNVDNLMVALPTTVRVSGGRTEGEAKVVHYTGGGDLTMRVGQDLLGSMILVANGTGVIDVAGGVRATEQVVQLRSDRVGGFVNANNLTLMLGEGSVSLQAGGDVNLRNVTSLFSGMLRYRNGKGNGALPWLSYGENTSARITSLGGDINILGVNRSDSGQPDYLPSKIAFVATAGSINFGSLDRVMNDIVVDMSKDTRVDILAQNSINFYTGNPGYSGGQFVIGWSDPSYVARVTTPAQPYGGNYGPDGSNGTVLRDQFGSVQTPNPLTGVLEFGVAGPGYFLGGDNVHEGSASFSRMYAAQGDLIGWNNYSNTSVGFQPHGGEFIFGHETRLKAGGNVRMGKMMFLTHDGDDMSTIEAGAGLYLPNAILYGPGRLWAQAGDEIYMGRTAGEGIRALAAISAISQAQPENGGSISMLAGIDQAPEYDSFLDYYLDPGNVAEAPSWLRQYFVPGERGLSASTDVVLADGSTKVTVYAIELVNYMRQLRGEALLPTEVVDERSGARDVTRGQLAETISAAEYAKAIADFRALDPALKQPLAIRILNAELKTAGREAVGASPETDGRNVRAGDPTRGYDALGRLFPGAQRKPGEALAAGEHEWTGDINMVVSQVRAESGGDVDLIAPGGSVQLASLSVANTNPGQAGIVTQRGGSITAIVRGDYIVNQSRTMTADDGDLMIWSSFGNIDAGRGRKSSLSVPPVAFPIDAWGQTRIQLSGLPNGAGIATLDQVDGKQGGDVDLYAFNGIVNAGDAGIRASRDLFIGATEIRGLDNITVGGISNVDLSSDEGSVGPLNLENFAQSAEDDALEQAFSMAAEVEKLRTVHQTILTGSVVSFGTDDCVPSADNPCPVGDR